jgi:SAM-dependent methyltransferase
VHWGFDRGTPIDRYYIECFLQRHRKDVRGRVLEIGDNAYTLQFGGKRVMRSDVLNIEPGAPNATIIADLATADHVESDLFDCIILTQTLQYIFDLPAAARTLRRILKPGGVLLLSVPGISQVDYDRLGEARCWSMTVVGLTRLLSECFPAAALKVESRGNVLAATAFLQGLSQEDIPSLETLIDDPHYPLIVLARAVKPVS